MFVNSTSFDMGDCHRGEVVSHGSFFISLMVSDVGPSFTHLQAMRRLSLEKYFRSSAHFIGLSFVVVRVYKNFVYFGI